MFNVSVGQNENVVSTYWDVQRDGSGRTLVSLLAADDVQN